MNYSDPFDVPGGGVIGCSTAYFLTLHALYNPKIHSVVILEASKIAGGSSGKAGGLLAEWATPKCLAPLSFKTHAQDLKSEVAIANGVEDGHEESFTTEVPSDLDWLLPGSVKSYTEAGNPNNSGQVNPLASTETLAQLAKEKGAEVIIGSATAINYRDKNSGISSVSYTQNGTSKTLNATDILLAAGPWTPKLFPATNLGHPPRGHSVVVRPSRDLSPYVLFSNISAPGNGSLSNLLSPEIYPRPGDKFTISTQFTHVDRTTTKCLYQILLMRLQWMSKDATMCTRLWEASQSQFTKVKFLQSKPATSHRLDHMRRTRSSHISPLHQQIVKGRQIIITENTELNWTWIFDRVFLKPVPAFLMFWAFWQQYLISDDSPIPTNLRDSLCRGALGYLRTYFHLIRHPSEFRLAIEHHLIPEDTNFERCSQFLARFGQRLDEVSPRYNNYGELKLGRLNLWAKFVLHRFAFQKV
ncbi:MAG: hypothetical protein Q9221_000219 [Calogaya cf. arnoldii]